MVQTDLAEVYGKSFFDSIERSALESAEAIVPLVMQLLCPRSVVDVGCGRGIWLRVFQDHSVAKARGIDGHHAAADKLFIPHENFTPVDLSTPFSIGDRYDLAVCLEVAEHLPESAAAGFVQELTKAAPCVLFSAAIPGQGGQHHINEQWPEYWHDLFRSNGFAPFDYFRPKLFHNRSVCWWYRQNLVLYVSNKYLGQDQVLAEALAEFRDCDLEWVYGGIFRKNRDYPALRIALRQIPSLFLRALKNRLQIRPKA